MEFLNNKKIPLLVAVEPSERNYSNNCTWGVNLLPLLALIMRKPTNYRKIKHGDFNSEVHVKCTFSIQGFPG